MAQWINGLTIGGQISTDTAHAAVEWLPENTGRRRFLGYAGAGMLLGVLPGCGGDDSNNQYSQTITWGRQAIEAALSPDVPAISIALFKKDQIVWQQAFGVTSGSGTPATTRTAFDIASVSKVFAALVAVILQDRKLITLDTPVVNYLPAFSMLSPEYANITTRHLLSHSSGLPGNNPHNFLSFAPLPGYADDTLAELANAHLKHLPGELAVYCNDGFTVFERVVSAVTGQSYAAFVQANILDPLGMTNSGFMTVAPLKDEVAHAYVAEKWSSSFEYVNAYAAGGLTSTPGDMMNFAQMLLAQGIYQGQRIASAAGIADMARDQTKVVGVSINPTADFPWGLGWDTGSVKALHDLGVTAWQKNGDTFFTNSLFVLPDAQMALMVTGYSGYARAALAEDIVLRALVEDGTIAALPAKIDTTAPSTASAPDMSSSAGIYANCKMVLQVAFNTGTLTLNVWSDDGWKSYGGSPYQYGSDGWWHGTGTTPGPDLSFTVVSGTDKAGNAYLYRYLMVRQLANAGYAYEVAPSFQQLDATRPALDAAWQARMGSQWKVTNESPETVRSVLTSGQLMAAISQLPQAQGYILMRNAGDSGEATYQMMLPLADDRAGMAVKIPVLDGRDLWEAVFTSASGAPAGMTIGGVIYEQIS